MKQTIMALIVITLFSCKKEPIGLNKVEVTTPPKDIKTVSQVVVWSKQHNVVDFYFNGGKPYYSNQLKRESQPLCGELTAINFTVMSGVYEYKFNTYEGLTGKGTVTLTEGCNSIELK